MGFLQTERCSCFHPFSSLGIDGRYGVFTHAGPDEPRIHWRERGRRGETRPSPTAATLHNGQLHTSPDDAGMMA